MHYSNLVYKDNCSYLVVPATRLVKHSEKFIICSTQLILDVLLRQSRGNELGALSTTHSLLISYLTPP